MGEGDMQVRWSQAELAFRDEVRAFLDAELTREMRRDVRRMTSLEFLQEVRSVSPKCSSDPPVIAEPISQAGRAGETVLRAFPAGRRARPDAHAPIPCV